jgi:hypothetical protein
MNADADQKTKTSSIDCADSPSPAFGRNPNQLTQRHKATKRKPYLGISYFVILVASCAAKSFCCGDLYAVVGIIWKRFSVIGS